MSKITHKMVKLALFVNFCYIIVNICKKQQILRVGAGGNTASAGCDDGDVGVKCEGEMWAKY